MKYIDEYRDAGVVRRIADCIARVTTRPWTIMEICGGQTHSILRYGLDQVLPEGIELVHGPGCPVCVTSVETLDRAIDLASRPGTMLVAFGDMLRVPGSCGDLAAARSRGADVRFVFSPLEALQLARKNPHKEVIFLAVGFETTAPGNAMAVRQAAREGLMNFSVLVSHFLVPPAMEAILSSSGNRVQGFLGAGHVCTVTGTAEYLPIARQFGVPVVVAGFEPVDLLSAILRLVQMLEGGIVGVENAYGRVVEPKGNPAALAVMQEVFEVGDAAWRGIGTIPASGLVLREGFREWDAVRKFDLAGMGGADDARCRSGEVLAGRIAPDSCEAFGRECRPEHPLGAPMVSGEGACAAYFRYRCSAASSHS